MKKIINPDISDQQEIRYARIASFGALAVAAYFGINPPSVLLPKPWPLLSDWLHPPSFHPNYTLFFQKED